ncbi:SPOR domain-containing protein [Methylobacterium organophilum]|uniref:SPOR domain-containing protein n=1 Tax=Methylobacterium organophilum TaxID=410 RepID=A0ABQ4TA40_METOR|nr:SPOR domain-containing protein [Methylobacterium organophilum]GJE27369.1 hypothetical protein LKMONMHP_2227 [Methylobacterium organophilum]
MTTTAARAPIDFDAFERELRQTSRNEHPGAPPKAPAPQAAKSDPLAELARIVGQDDPFRALLETRGGAPSRERTEPRFEDAPAPRAEPSPADAFDQYLASVEQSAYGHPAAHAAAPADELHDPAAFEETDPGHAAPAGRRPRGSRMVQVGAGLGVLALCVTGALGWRAFHGGGQSGPVTVLADKTPLKVAPTNADGVEIPDQNKQIYERNAKDGQIKIVNREEQPLDVAAAARAAQSKEASAPGGTGASTPPQTGLLTESLGEPRRVRTVSVKPDTPPPAPQRDAAAESANAGPSPIPTMVLPDDEGTATPAARRPPLRNQPATQATATPAPAPTQAAEAHAPATPVPAPAPVKAKPAPQRVAAVAPETTASMAEPAAAPAAEVTSGPVSGFSVQLGVRNSAAEAQAAFRQMQAKYSQLAGKPELIRQAEVNGKTIFRVRVGPLEKAEATSLCSQLQGAGGQCFVAKN